MPVALTCADVADDEAAVTASVKARLRAGLFQLLAQ